MKHEAHDVEHGTAYDGGGGIQIPRMHAGGAGEVEGEFSVRLAQGDGDGGAVIEFFRS